VNDNMLVMTREKDSLIVEGFDAGIKDSAESDGSYTTRPSKR